MTDELWVLRPNEGKTMVDSMKRRELLRLSVRWPLTIRTDSGEADGETRNITGEGIFLYCSVRLREGVAYPLTIKFPEKRVEMTGKLTWSNFDSFTSLNFNPAMGFYFMRIDDDKDKQILGEAIHAECRKPAHLKQEANRHTDSFHSSKTESTAHIDGIAGNTRLLRN